MSRHLLVFLLSELRTVRLICTRCGVVSEMTIAKMSTHMDPAKCPSCHEDLCPLSERDRKSTGEDTNPFRMLGQAIESLAREKTVQIEFVLPAEEKD